jgi:uncharacterized protein
MSLFGVVVVAAAAGLLALAGPASAHVTVTAPGATSGGSDQEITFRVPVEKTIDTVGLTIQLPTTTPIASVLVEPMAGWTHTQKTVTLAKPIVTDDGDITQAVSQISWTAAAGQGLTPGEFGEFTIIAGQLPTASQLVFPAIQTYSDGSVVSWNQVAAPGSTVEPDNPAPILLLSASSPTAQPAATSKSSDTAAVVLAIVALVVALLALGLAVVSRARRAGGVR